MSRTCLSQRQPLKNRQLPLLLRPLLQPTSLQQKLLLTRRPPARHNQQMTRTEFVEPGRPTALPKCSAKGELLESHRVNLDLTDYSNLNIGEIVSSFVSQVHKSRDAEIAMVTQIQQKSEVLSFCPLTYCIVTFTMLAPKSTTYD